MADAILYETKPFRPSAKPHAPNGRDPNNSTKFEIEPWDAIKFEGDEEWAIKRFLPARGIAALYGKPGSLKSFVAVHMALSRALGREWAGRRVSQAPVIYIAAEGAGGLRKRKAGYEIAWPNMPTSVPFYLISAAPNLGSEQSDVQQIAADITEAGIKPGLIVIDTLAQTLGSGDENGSGMIAFASNAAVLAKQFDALVLVIHHSGLSEGAQQRMRGHSSFHGALDALILCERSEGELAATLTLQKLKDESANVKLTAHFSRVVIGEDEDGDEISTLVVDEVEKAEREINDDKPKAVARSQRLLMAVVAEAIDDANQTIRPFANGPEVRAASEAKIREIYFTRMAEKADPDEDPDKLYDRQRKNFRNAVEGALKAQALAAKEISGERLIWKP